MPDLGDLTPYILILGVLVTSSAFFSGTEVAMFSLRRVDREQMSRSTRKGDRLIVKVLARPRRLITTLLIGNETVNVSVSAVLAGMAPMLYPGRTDVELGLLATLTALPILLLLGEITPKTVAIKSSVTWSRAVIRPLRLFAVLVTPVRWVVQAIANLVLIPLGAGKLQGSDDLSEEEFKNLIDAGSAEGALDDREHRLIHRVFEFGDKPVGQVMRPRAGIFALPGALPLPAIVERVGKHGYSRVPIYGASIDDIIGVIHVKDLVVLAAEKEPRPLRDIMHESLMIPLDAPCEDVFEAFKERRIHMAFVCDAADKVVGLVTMEDLLEELFGEIRDEREHKKALPLRPESYLALRVGRRTVSGQWRTSGAVVAPRPAGVGQRSGANAAPAPAPAERDDASESTGEGEGEP